MYTVLMACCFCCTASIQLSSFAVYENSCKEWWSKMCSGGDWWVLLYQETCNHNFCFLTSLVVEMAAGNNCAIGLFLSTSVTAALSDSLLQWSITSFNP